MRKIPGLNKIQDLGHFSKSLTFRMASQKVIAEKNHKNFYMKSCKQSDFWFVTKGLTLG